MFTFQMEMVRSAGGDGLENQGETDARGDVPGHEAKIVRWVTR